MEFKRFLCCVTNEKPAAKEPAFHSSGGETMQGETPVIANDGQTKGVRSAS